MTWWTSGSRTAFLPEPSLCEIFHSSTRIKRTWQQTRRRPMCLLEANKVPTLGKSDSLMVLPEGTLPPARFGAYKPRRLHTRPARRWAISHPKRLSTCPQAHPGRGRGRSQQWLPDTPQPSCNSPPGQERRKKRTDTVFRELIRIHPQKQNTVHVSAVRLAKQAAVLKAHQGRYI